MDIALGILGSTAILFGTFLFYLAIAMLLSRGYKLIFGKRHRVAR